MKITFNIKTIKIKPATEAEIAEVSEAELISISDMPTEKKIVALVNVLGIDRVITLWEDEAYDKVGDWSQEQANQKIIELL
jgi:hypothetical protein